METKKEHKISRLIKQTTCKHICQIGTPGLDIAGYFRTFRKNPDNKQTPLDGIKFENIQVKLLRCISCDKVMVDLVQFHTKKQDFIFDMKEKLMVVKLDGSQIDLKKVYETAKKQQTWW
jgi:hypothetical protein